jgi:hypothetical protein
MQLARPAIAIETSGHVRARTSPGRAARVHPRRFGRGQVRNVRSAESKADSFGADLKLFALTFLAGFVFVSVLIG